MTPGLCCTRLAQKVPEVPSCPPLAPRDTHAAPMKTPAVALALLSCLACFGARGAAAYLSASYVFAESPIWLHQAVYLKSHEGSLENLTYIPQMSYIRLSGSVPGVVSGVLAQELRGARRADAQQLLPSPAVTVGHGLFASDCATPGAGTTQVARGPGGCVNAQPGLAGFKKAQQQTIMSFLVEPCGVVAPHLHANSVEINTVIRGSGVIGQLTTDTNSLEVSEVSEGDSFFFAEAAYHWWVNLGDEALVTIGVFFNTDDPDTALVGYDDEAGLVGTLMQDTPLLNTMIGRSNGRKNTVPLQQGESPLFPKLTPEACAAARSRNRQVAKQSFQKNPSGTNMFRPDELHSGKFGLTAADTPVSCPKPPCGGGPLSSCICCDVVKSIHPLLHTFLRLEDCGRWQGKW